jgi:hypothetical protein
MFIYVSHYAQRKSVAPEGVRRNVPVTPPPPETYSDLYLRILFYIRGRDAEPGGGGGQNTPTLHMFLCMGLQRNQKRDNILLDKISVRYLLRSTNCAG